MILFLESRKELNALCNSIINYKVTIEEVKGDQDCAVVTTSTRESSTSAPIPKKAKVGQ